jgi:hypothetical protein
MRLDIHIMRAEYWAESDENPITADEWLILVQDDAEQAIDGQKNGPFVALLLPHRINNDPVLFS